jgi:hypothetical protein
MTSSTALAAEFVSKLALKTKTICYNKHNQLLALAANGIKCKYCKIG